MDLLVIDELASVIVLYLFLPVTALTYFFFRQQRRGFEVERILTALDIDPSYRQIYRDEKPGYQFLCAAAYVSVVACIGLTLLFLGNVFFESGEFPPLLLGDTEFPQKGSRLVFGMAFFGAYVWGLQYIFRRYALNDLTPDVYYNLSMRMILAALVAFLIYNTYGALGGEGGEPNIMGSGLWPILAFLLGIFPQRGLRWLLARIPILSSETNPAVKEAPLSLIEGIEDHDQLRLHESGIDSCYDLANVDFVPLLIATPYSARALVDWILQAKLCIYFGADVQFFRQYSIRTILDLKELTSEDVEVLVSETALTRSALERVRKSIQNNVEIERLIYIGQLIGQFSKLQVCGNETKLLVTGSE